LKALVVYLSTSENTKAMAEAIANGIASRNIDAKAISFYEVKPEELQKLEQLQLGLHFSDNSRL
jgi:flavorubredoxin